MNIKFEKVLISDFMSFGRSEISLDEPGYTLVRGINNNVDDMAVSNGTGKSSIWEAITWVLTGETIRGCKNVTNSNGDDGALVELFFTADGNSYHIRRTKDHSKFKSSLTIEINGVDKSGKGIRDSEKLLSEYLPEITSSLLGSVIILGQGMPSRFTNNTPSGRKEVLEKLSNSDYMIEDIKSRINKRLTYLNTSKRTIEDDILILHTEQSLLTSDRERKQATLDGLQSVQSLEEQKFAIETELSNLVGEESAESELVAKLESEMKTLESGISEIKLDGAQKEVEITKSFDEQIRPVQVEFMQLRAEIDSLKKEIKKKDAIVDVCPTCGQKLVGVEKPDTTADKELVEELQVALDTVDAKIQVLEKNREAEVAESKRAVLTKAAEIESQLKSVKEEFQLHVLKHRMLERDIVSKTDGLNKIINDIYNSESTAKSLAAAISDIDNRLVDIDEKLLYNEHEKTQISNRIDTLNKMNTAIKREFRGCLLSNVITYIDNQAGVYCQDILGHRNVSLKLDGNNVSVLINGKEYEQLSGGERQKLDIIIQLAIRDMLCKYMGFSSNIFVLDEIFDNLDEVGSEKVLNLISSRLSDVTSVYIVTHHASIPIPVDREIVVVKDVHGISGVV